VVAHAPQLVVAGALMDDERFAAWVRPRAYDALHALGDADASAAALLKLVGPKGLGAIVAAPPAACGPDEAYCARCGRVYRAATVTCAECPGVALAAAARGAGDVAPACAVRASA
jgi:hypothetical protein